MKRVLDLIKFEKDRIADVKEMVEKGKEFGDKCIVNGKETRLKFMGELYDSETILNRLEEQVKILIKVDENKVQDENIKDNVELFRELAIDDVLKGLCAIMQPVPTKKEKTKEEIEEEKRKKEVEFFKEKAIKQAKYPSRIFSNCDYGKKHCELLCNIVLNDELKRTHGKIFVVERENPYEVVIYLDGVMVNIPKNYVRII